MTERRVFTIHNINCQCVDCSPPQSRHSWRRRDCKKFVHVGATRCRHCYVDAQVKADMERLRKRRDKALTRAIASLGR